jgi:hypothetical protein
MLGEVRQRVVTVLATHGEFSLLSPHASPPQLESSNDIRDEPHNWHADDCPKAAVAGRREACAVIRIKRIGVVTECAEREVQSRNRKHCRQDHPLGYELGMRLESGWIFRIERIAALGTAMWGAGQALERVVTGFATHDESVYQAHMRITGDAAPQGKAGIQRTALAKIAGAPLRLDARPPTRGHDGRYGCNELALSSSRREAQGQASRTRDKSCAVLAYVREVRRRGVRCRCTSPRVSTRGCAHASARARPCGWFACSVSQLHFESQKPEIPTNRALRGQACARTGSGLRLDRPRSALRLGAHAAVQDFFAFA